MRSFTSFTPSAALRLRKSIIFSILLTCGALLSASPVFAAVLEGVDCIEDQPAYTKGTIGCTANDIQLSSPLVFPAEIAPGVFDSCDYAGDTITLDILFDLTTTATNRYDIAVWFSIDSDPNGDGPATGAPGACTVASLPNNLQMVTDLAPSIPTNYDTDFDGDFCGDVSTSGENNDKEVTILSPQLTDVNMGQMTLLCQDSDQDGFMDVPVIVAWTQKSSTVCTAANEAVPDTSSKCSFDNSLRFEVPIPGRIIVDKVTVPADGTLFDFSLTGPDSGIAGGFTGTYDFQLADATTPFDSAMFTGGLVPGLYSITEDPNAAYLTEVSCVSDLNGPVADPTAIDLGPGETVNCTFTNTMLEATINVVKNSLGGNETFNIDWTGPTTNGTFVLNTNDGNGTDSDQLVTADIGTFSLQEVSIPAGWVLTNAGCVNDDGGAAVGTWDQVDTISGIDLQNQMSITCTFTNSGEGSVTLVKNTVGGDGSFDFVTDVPGLGTNISTSGGTGSISASNVPTGTYSIVETVPAGWNLDSATCDNESPPDALVITAGETVTCTFTDIELGTIIVEKQTLPDGSPQTFDFSGNVAGTIGDGGTITVNNLLPGTYTSTETVPAGWDLTSIVCDDSEPGIPSTGDIGTGQATFNLDAGETVTCVFTNTQRGSIEVVKSLSATGPAVELFDFNSNFNGAFQLDGDLATTGPIEVTPGSGYTVTEVDPFDIGWSNTGASCTGGDVPATNITVSPGENVVCTFTNTPLGSATIIKNTVGGDGIFDFTGDEPFNGLQLETVAGTASQDYEYQLLGQYTVTEAPIPQGWMLTSVGCEEDGIADSSGANPSALLNVELLETVTCTFTNTADGTLIIRKEAIPEVEQPFEFTGDAAGVIFDYSVTADQIEVSGQPGPYTSTELVPPGWQVTDINCTGQVQSGVTYGDTDVSVDLAAGETVICTFENTALGSITIEKLTGGGEGSFTFNRSGDFSGSFPLDTTGGNNPAGQTFSNLLPGSYMVSEIVPANWSLAAINCVGDEGSTVTIGGEGGFDPGDTGVTIDLLNGEDITCQFTNVAWGNIIVDKVTDPQGSTQSFDFTTSYGAPFSLTDGDTPNDSGPIAPSWPAGTYSVAEGALPAGWSLTDATCTDGEVVMTPDIITLPAGGTVTCTFTNTIQRGAIIVEKQTDPDGSTEDFGFTTSFGAPFSLTDGQTNNSGPLLPTSEAGTYSVAEDAEAGWDLTSATCDDGSPVNAIDLSPGETVTCTFTNTVQRGNIIVDKVTDPAGSAQLFAFTLTGTGVDLDFALSDADTPYDSGDLLPTSENGTYNVDETLPAGWDLTSATCDDGSPASAVDLAPGETVTCTFTNTIQRGTIIVEKVTDPDTSLVEFEFTTSYDVDPFMLGHGDQDNSGPLLPTSESGTYAVTEALPAGWSQTSATCDDGSDPATIDLGPGETVTCTFTNTILRGNIIVEKQTLPDGSPEIFFFSSNFGGAFDLEDDEQYDSGDLLPTSEASTYSVSEDAMQGWDMTSATCSDGSPVDAIDLQPDETVTCVFENTQRASITIVKQAIGLPDGEFCFSVSGPQLDDSFCILTSGGSGSDGDGNLLPGLYSFNELIEGQYYPASTDCSNGDTANAVDLGPGDDVTCTFVNVPVAPVPVNNTLALLLLTLMLLATGWYFRPAGMRR